MSRVEAVERRYLITGAAGFVGGTLVRHLLKRVASGTPMKLRALVRKREQVAPFQALGVEVVLGDLTDPESLREAVRGVDGVYHIAAEFRRAGISDADYVATNVGGTRNLLRACVENGVTRFIHCSTVGVLGHIEHPPADEQAPYNPGDIYQRSKVAGESVVREFFDSGRLKGVIIRPGMIWGPGDTRTRKLFSSIASGRFFFVGPGNALVHFIDVRDLAVAFELAMNAHDVTNETFIVAGRESLPLKDLVALISRECGAKEPRLHVPLTPVWWLGAACELLCRPLGIEPPIFRRRVDFFTKNRSFNTAKSHAILGFAPSQNLEQEVADIVAWYHAYGWIPSNHGIVSHSGAPSVMVRDIHGKIREWSGAAEKFYGFDSQHATGAVSHQLLRTSFPQPIELINEHMLKKKRWEGQLIHRRRDGSSVSVRSCWKLVPDMGADIPVVFEVNWPESTDDSSERSSKSRFSRGALCGAMISSQTESLSLLEPFLAAMG